MPTTFHSIDGDYESIMITDTELHLSPANIRTEAEFAAARNAAPDLQRIVPISAITEVTSNDQSTLLTLTHAPILGDPETYVDLNDEIATRRLRDHIVAEQRLKLAGTEEESTMSILFANGLPLLGAIAAFIFFMSVTEEEVAGRRGRKGAAILKLLYGILGQTGVLILIALVAAFLAYQLFQSLTNRSVYSNYK